MALPKDSFLSVKRRSARTRWWFPVSLFLRCKVPLFSVLWSGYAWCLLTALGQLLHTLASTDEPGGCTFPTAASKKASWIFLYSKRFVPSQPVLQPCHQRQNKNHPSSM